MTSIAEYLAESAFRDAESVVRYRDSAGRKIYAYKTRLMFDGLAAAGEQRIVDKANKLIELASAK